MVKPYEPLYTVQEAAKVLKTSKNEVYNLINQGKLPCLIIESKKIRGMDLEAYINKHPQETEVSL